MAKVRVTQVYEYNPDKGQYASFDESAYGALLASGTVRSWPPESTEERMAMDKFDYDSNQLELVDLDAELIRSETEWEVVEQ